MVWWRCRVCIRLTQSTSALTQDQTRPHSAKEENNCGLPITRSATIVSINTSPLSRSIDSQKARITTSTMTLEPIPQPPTHLYGMLASLPEIDPSFPLSSFWRLHALYGPIFQLDLISRKVIVLSSYELAHEVMDDERFEKVITAGLKELRPLIKDGLFSAFPHEPVSSVDPTPTRNAVDTESELVEGTPHAHARLWSHGRPQDVPRTARHRLATNSAMGQIRAHSPNRHRG